MNLQRSNDWNYKYTVARLGLKNPFCLVDDITVNGHKIKIKY